jgi:hypothetical protein
MKREEKQEIYSVFYNNVNMTPSELEKWLDTEKSKSVGQDSGDGESIGHKSGRKIIKIKRTKKADLTESKYEHMKQVNSYVARHSAQKPSGNVEDSNWRYSLKNWGHDPLK